MSGVLHHLGDPWQGWRALLTLLRPGGVMQVGLYSKLARQNVVAARALIAERGYRPVPEDIRRCREEILAAADGSLLKSASTFSDFFTTNECRDLIFHVQEHQMTLPQIKAFLMDQKRVAGLGNIYVAEALYRAGIHPAAAAGRVRPRAPELLAAIQAVLRGGIARRGTTLRDYVDADGRSGDNGPALLVYGRAGEACRRCGASGSPAKACCHQG